MLNQLEDKSHHIKTLSITAKDNVHAMKNPRDRRALGFPKFIHHSELAHDPVKNTYLKDDTLYFRVSVEVPNHKPWLECIISCAYVLYTGLLASENNFIDVHKCYKT